MNNILDNSDDDNDDEDKEEEEWDDEEDEEEDALGEGLVNTGLHSLSAGVEDPSHLYNMLDPCGDDNDDDEEEEEEGPCIRALSTPGCTASLQVWVPRDTCTTC